MSQRKFAALYTAKPGCQLVLYLDYAFENVFGHSTRPLCVYSDVNASTVLSDQITDF